MLHLLQKDRTDLALSADHFKLNRSKLLSDATGVVNGFRKNETEMPGISNQVADALDRGWHYATLLFGETQIRTGHLLVAMLKSLDLKRALLHVSPEFGKISAEELAAGYRSIWAESEEGNLRPMDGSGLAAAGADGTVAAPGAKGTTALDRFSQDLTAKAKSGEMDPILGRDEEIRQIIDVLMRRRQNNPILTGEAGVGKTAVVEGFAQRIASGDVPPPLRNVKLHMLDVGLMQAGASMKGEFEQRLRSVIDEVQSSPTPIILFIDEAHTLIGAGGAAGTGDAANLLKPALARGTLRTIAATTFAEYRQHIEKDPALTRRFQPIQIGEPDVEKAAIMLRGLIGPMEKHHKVRVSDAAIVCAVQFSHRYIPARQLPDKAVSLLDTACARVAISQNAKPAAIEDAQVHIAALEQEREALMRERDLGAADEERITEIDEAVVTKRAELATLESEWASERKLVEEIQALRARLAAKAEGGDKAEADKATGGEKPAAPEKAPSVEQAALSTEDAETARTDLRGKVNELEAIVPEKRMVYAHVDEQAVASVVSDWTGIPVGRMVADEVETVLKLAEILNRRVVGQSHGLSMIAKRIETNRAKLDNPNKPIGVFMLCGPSGVGKTETALALAETLYGGEQNMITINMSEFQEAHTVSTLKGAPPGLCRLRRGRAPHRGGSPAPLQRDPARRGRKGPSRRARDILPGVRQGRHGGRHGPAHRFQEYADHSDLECRHRRHHGRGERAARPGPGGVGGRTAPRLAERLPAGAARPHRDHPVFSALSGNARRHRASPAWAHRQADRREPRREVRLRSSRRRPHRVPVQRPGFGWTRHRQHHHQYDPARVVAGNPQTLAGARRNPRSQGDGRRRGVRL